MGLLKLDALGLSALSVLHYAFDLIKRNHDTEINIEEDVDFEDPNVYEEFRNGNCTGIFQFNTWGIRELVQELRVDNFDLLSATTALFRPGPLRSGFTEKFKRIRNGFEEEEYFSPVVKDLLQPTLGVIVYQEQIMLATHYLTGWSMLESDKFRKVLDWDQDHLIEPYHEPFVKSCMDNLFADESEAEHLWHEIEQYRSYLFNKAHAYAYTAISFYDMWTKCYFPAEFLCASLTYGADENKKHCLINALEYGLKVQFPKVGKSHAILWETDGETLYMPFVEIKGFGEKTATKAMNYNDDTKRDGFFGDPREYFSGKMLNLLEGINAFDDTIPTDIEGKLSFDIDQETFRLIRGE
jgi:DNA polymerase-3 subunit alpha